MDCKSEGCKSEATSKASDIRIGVGGRPGPIGGQFGQRIWSKYCPKHTCEHFYEPEGCMYKKPQHDEVCAGHSRCPVPGCGQCKGQYADMKNAVPGMFMFRRHAFCVDHKCSVAECENPRRPSGPNRPLIPFCLNHGCASEGCAEMPLEQRNYCPNHQCKELDCDTIAEGNYALCSMHVVCEPRVCNRARHVVPRGQEVPVDDMADLDIQEYSKRQYLSFCLEHGTCGAASCAEFRLVKSRFCSRHTCPERDCKTSTGERQYCETHRCESLSCDSPKGWQRVRNRLGRTRLCSLHTCRKSSCQLEAEDMHFFCGKHECSDTACLSEAIAEALCLDHFKAKYQREGKLKAQSELEGWLAKLSFRGNDGPVYQQQQQPVASVSASSALDDRRKSRQATVEPVD